MTRGLRRLLIVLIAVCSPNAMAFSSYLGLRAEVFSPSCVLCGGFQLGLDAERSSGSGVRLSYTTLAFILLSRVGLDAYYRVPLEGSDANAYLGAGGSWGFGIIFTNLFEVHALIGLEWMIGPNAGVFVEGMLGVVVGGSRQSMFGEPPPPGYIPPALVGTPSASVGIGLNFRL